MTLETDVAVQKEQIKIMEKNVDEIKAEVHEINSYLRNELINQVKKSNDKLIDIKKERRAKMQLWGAIGLAGASLIITSIHFIF